MSRTVTLAGYVVLAASGLVLEARSRWRGHPAPFGRMVGSVVRRPWWRVFVLASWLWLGWHAFVRVNW